MIHIYLGDLMLSNEMKWYIGIFDPTSNILMNVENQLKYSLSVMEPEINNPKYAKSHIDIINALIDKLKECDENKTMDQVQKYDCLLKKLKDYYFQFQDLCFKENNIHNLKRGDN